MPIAGLGLHVVIALICAIHAVRSGQPLYWLFVLFAFALLGSAVYFFAAKLDDELQKIQSRWDAMARHLNEPVTRRYQAARALARQPG
jgi:hypothetical protein